MKKDLITILLVDDHNVVLEGMQAIIAQLPAVKVSGAVLNAFAALNFLKTNTVDIVISDISLPDISGIELCATIKKDYPATQIIGLSTFKQRSYVSQMINNGASGYLLKSSGKEEIEEAINSVFQGKLYFSADINNNKIETLQNQAVPILTRREKEILQLIAEGLTNSDIAQKVFISQHTVDTHRKNLLAKLEVTNTALLIKKGVEMGLIC